MNVSEKQGTGSMILPLNVERNKVKTLGEKMLTTVLAITLRGLRGARGEVRCITSRMTCADVSCQHTSRSGINPLACKGDCGDSSNNMKLVHSPLMGVLLCLVQQGGDWAKP